MVIRKNKVFLLFVILLIVNCGSADTSGGDVPETNESDSINTTKLVGTPFEEFEYADEYKPYLFLCDQYQTSTIDELPIKIFTAFFTEAEEKSIQEGITIANEAAGIELYRLTDTWEDNNRVMFKVPGLGARAEIDALYMYFDGKIVAKEIAVDWAIKVNIVNKWVIAHELGHASGISSHALIDYENDTIIDLEENSLMDTFFIGTPELNNYNYMMSIQAQTIQDYLDIEGNLSGGDCAFLKEYYGE